MCGFGATVLACVGVPSHQKGRRTAVIARVAALEGTREQLSEMGEMLADGTLPELKQRQGFRGFLWLTAPERGRALLINVWDSMEAHQASERLWRAEGAMPVAKEVGLKRTFLGGYQVEIGAGLVGS
jgi:hypothetical protein